MWRRAADEDAETRPPLTAEDASETKLDYFKLLVFASSFRNRPAPGFVSDFRGFGCSVSLVHFLFYFEGFSFVLCADWTCLFSAAPISLHDYRRYIKQTAVMGCLFQIQQLSASLRSELLTSIISASGGFRQTGADRDTKAEAEPWGGWFFFIFSGRFWWKGGKENIKPCLNQMK